MKPASLESVMWKNVELEKELAATSVIVNQVREQRDAYRNHFEKLKVETIRIKNESTELQRQAGELHEAKVVARQEHEEQRKEWAMQLERKAREFDEIRSQLIPPRELEMMRVKLLEEVELPWKQKCKGLEQELEKYRSMYFTVRRENEWFKNEFEQKEAEHKTALEEQQQISDSKINDLQSQLSTMQETMKGESDDMERLRTLQRERMELTLRHEKMLEELEDLRSETEVLQMQKDQAALQAGAQLNEERTHLHLLQVEKESLVRKISHLEKDLEVAEGEHDKLHAQVLRLETDLRASKDTVAETQFTLKSEQTAHEVRIAEIEREAEHTKVDLERRNEESLHRLEALQQAREELLLKMSTMERDTLVAVSRAREEEMAKVRRAQAEKAKLDTEISELHIKETGAAAQAAEKLEAANAEVNQLKSQVHSLEVDKKGLTEQIPALRRQVEEAELTNKTVSDRLEKLQGLHSELQEKHRHVVTSEHELSAANEKLGLQLEYAQKDVAIANAAAETEKHAAIEAFEQMKHLVSKDRAAHKQVVTHREQQLEALKKEFVRVRSGLQGDT